jgi:hypothetical protein
MRILISTAFFALAIWFLMFSGVGVVPVTDLPPIKAEDISIEPRREMLQDPATIRLGGLDQTCQSCHSIFPSSQDEPKELMQHKEIVLEHGLNNRCDNCHTKGDHDKLVLYGGKEVGFSEVQLLCAKCHGPTYRDWEKGMHGKTLGSWETGAETQQRLLCTECHDPHHPAFTSYEPLRGPHTLRQHATEQKVDNVHAGKRNPLRHWQKSDGHGASSGGSH